MAAEFHLWLTSLVLRAEKFELRVCPKLELLEMSPREAEHGALNPARLTSQNEATP